MFGKNQLEGFRKLGLSPGLKIPHSYSRLSKHIPYFIKSEFYGIFTAATKVGKTKWMVDELIVNPLIYYFDNKLDEQFWFPIRIYSLEISEFMFRNYILSALLFRVYGYSISPDDLVDKASAKKLTPEEEYMIEQLDVRYPKIESHISIMDTTKDVNVIKQDCFEWLLNYGQIIEGDVVNGISQITGINYYFPCLPQIIIDNYNNFVPQNREQMTDLIGLFSKDFVLEMRDKFKCCIWGVQQQDKQSDTVQYSYKNEINESATRPTTNALSQCKTTPNDVNLLLALYYPFKYSISECEGYLLTTDRHAHLENNFRLLMVLDSRGTKARMNLPLYLEGNSGTFFELPPSRITIKDPVTGQMSSRFNDDEIVSFVKRMRAMSNDEPLNVSPSTSKNPFTFGFKST